jgi:branched-chain amino acid transport system substrate-binding protein
MATFVACGDDDGGEAGGDDSAPSETADELECEGPAATGEAVTIGFMWPEGGEAINQPAVGEAARATVEYVNDCLGGIGGRPIELSECPEGENQADITACANQFIEADVAAVSVSATGMPEAIAGPVTEAGIPFTSANGVGAEQINPSVFIWPAGVLGALGGAATYASENDIDSVAIVTGDALIGPITPLAQPAFDAAGVELRFVGVPQATPDLTPQLRTALQDDPGMLLVVGDETMCISYLQGVQSLQTDVPAAVIQTCTAQAVIDAVGEDGIEGKIVIGATDTRSDDPEAVLYRAVMAEYAPDTDPFGFAAFGYLSILGLVRAAEGVTDVTPEALMTAFGRDLEHPLPIGGGATFNCGVTYFVSPVALQGPCSGSTVVGVVEAGELTDTEVLDVAPLFGG